MTAAVKAYAVLAVVLLCIAASALGWKVGTSQEHDRRVAEVATIKRDFAEAQTRIVGEVNARLIAAQARGDALSAKLLQNESDMRRTALEKAHEIARLTTGRSCLNAATVRMLNATGNDQPGSVPSTASGPAAADGSAATDTDVAVWADNARRQFDTCRGRLDALIDFNVHNLEKNKETR
jgi:hypothetical protein